MKYESYYDGIPKEIREMTVEERDKEIERLEKELKKKNSNFKDNECTNISKSVIKNKD